MAIAALELAGSQAAAETGFVGSYAGIPVDLGTLLNNNPNLVPTPDNLANAAMNQALQSTGVTADYNPTSTGQPKIGAQIQGRYDLPTSPISVRGSVYLGDNAKAFMPVVTYDLPVGQGTNVYAGAGVSLVNTKDGKTTPLGNKTGVVVTTGVETEISKGIVLYGDAKWLPANRGAAQAPVRYQLGVGYRF